MESPEKSSEKSYIESPDKNSEKNYMKSPEKSSVRNFEKSPKKSPKKRPVKRSLKALYMAFGMFCAVPVPVLVWDEDCADMMMPSFPIVGLFIGAVWWGAARLLTLSGIHIMLAAAAMTIVSLLAAGLIHLDGFMDTCDAVLSRRPPEEKARILKDPHTGSFAVIMAIVLVFVQFAAAYVIIENAGRLVLLFVIPVISRSCSAMSMMCIRPAAHSGYAKLFKPKPGATRKLPPIVFAVCAIGFMYLTEGYFGLIVAAAAFAGFAAAMAGMCRTFKGVSGDLAGFALVISELCGLIALALSR